MGRRSGSKRTKPVIEEGLKVKGRQKRERLIRTFGERVSDKALAGIAGAESIDDVTITTRENTIKLTTKDGQSITVRRGANGAVLLVDVSLSPKRVGKSLQELQKLGYKHAVLRTKRTKKDTSYYNAALVGFDAKIPKSLKTGGNVADRLRKRTKPVPDFVKKAERVSDLMRSAQGRAWWKANGVGMKMSFDLRRTSRSSRRLTRYVSRQEN